MSRLPLNTLPAFVAVAQQHNLRAAAKQLHLTHGAISQQIKGLEEQLGYTLFDRRERKMLLNAAGQSFYPYAQEALQMLETGAQAAALAATSDERHIRMTVVPSFTQRWLLPRMTQWRTLHPDIHLTIEASQQVIDLPSQGFHVAIRIGEGQWPGLIAERLTNAKTTRLVLGSPTMAQRLQNASAAQLADEPLLGSKAMWEYWFAQAGVPRIVTPVAVFNDAGFKLQAAEQGLGLALGHQVLAADALRQGTLVQISPFTVQWESSRAYHLAYPPSLAAWPPLVALRDWLMQELANPD